MRLCCLDEPHIERASRACQIDLHAKARGEDSSSVRAAGKRMRELERSRNGEVEIGAEITGNTQYNERVEGYRPRESASLTRYASDVVAREHIVDPFRWAADGKCSSGGVIRPWHIVPRYCG